MIHSIVCLFYMIEFGVVSTINIGFNTLILFCYFYLNVANNHCALGVLNLKSEKEVQIVTTFLTN